MDFGFGEDEESYRREVRRFAARALAPRNQADDRAARLHPGLVAEMAALGLTGLRIPEAHGGQAASAVAAGIAAEEVGAAHFSATYLIINTALVSDVLTRHATAEQQARWLGVSFPLAEYATYTRGARHVCYEALWRKDRGLPHATEAAMAKFWAPRLATEIIHQSLLTFGHTGYSSKSPLGQRLRDVIGLEIGDGTAQISLLVIARALLGREYAP